MANQHSETNQSKSLCILVADDLEVNQKIAQLILQKAGHRVDLAANGQQAVAACKRHCYDLIFMDIQMPIMDGYEATRKIRELQLIAHSSKLKAMEAEGEKEESEVGMRKSEKGQDFALKSKIPGPDRMREDSVNNGQPNKQPDMVKYYQSSRARAGQNPKSKIDFVPIIAMTGNAVEGGFDESQYPVMDDCLDKPLQRDRLLEMVLKWTRPANGKPAVDRPVADGLPTSKNSGNGQLPLDINRAVQEFMGQKKLLFSVLKKFIENAGIRVDVIRRAVKSNDCDLIAQEAHAIKGGAANLTADVLAATAADLERAAVEQRTELTHQLTAELDLKLHDLQTFIRENVIGMD